MSPPPDDQQYLNIRHRDELGRDIAVVEPDPDRHELVRWAFAVYTTGNRPRFSVQEF